MHEFEFQSELRSDCGRDEGHELEENGFKYGFDLDEGESFATVAEVDEPDPPFLPVFFSRRVFRGANKGKEGLPIHSHSLRGSQPSVGPHPRGRRADRSCRRRPVVPRRGLKCSASKRRNRGAT